MSETGEIKSSGTHIAMSNLGHIRLKGRRLERLTQKKRGYKYKICSDRLSNVFEIFSLFQMNVFFFKR